MANVTSDLLASGVWQLGLFIVATARHGIGEAQMLYRELEAWMAANGAAWVRLGVVLGNARAERFWERQGFGDVRRRLDVVMGQRSNTLRVMAKPLTGQSIEAYLQLVARDRADAP
jgi:ribosomal protein S18 acetylase RimI-like enzyme